MLSLLDDGWHEVYGDTGRTALMWSLASLRGGVTVLVQAGEPYDYRQVAQWAGIPESRVLVVESSRDLLPILGDLCDSGQVGQVIFEGLGFLLGSGHMLPEVEAMLGDVTEFFRLSALAEQYGIALYVSSHPVSDFMAHRALGRERPLGGRLIEELCAEHRLKVEHVAYLSKWGGRVGERFRAVNVGTGESCTYDLFYAQGPVRERG